MRPCTLHGAVRRPASPCQDAGPRTPSRTLTRTPPRPWQRLLLVPPLLLSLVLQQAAGAGGAEVRADALADVGEDVYASTGCLFEGVRYKPGQAVPVQGEPCVRCRCRRGAPVCRLRVCAPQPDPPPPGCVLLHRANACCPELHCPDHAGPVDNHLASRRDGPMAYRSDVPNKGCYLNGSLFAEGSALSSSGLCEYCYCVRGQQRCVRPQCVLPAPGCVPEYRDHTCCPTRYNCGAGVAVNDTTTARPTRRPTGAAGCTVDGRRYREGEQVKSVARGRCEGCFCMRGRVRCAPFKCDLPLDGCQPVSAPGKCCPVSYDCSKSRVSITKTVSSASSHATKSSTGRPTKGENVVRSISYDARSNREISSTDTSKVTIEIDHPEQNVIATTPRSILEEMPIKLTPATADNIAITLNAKLDLGNNLDILKPHNNTILPEKSKILPVIEAIINKTRQKDQDYDYDYNEPSLPPSLPNLRIIPFVAADAVVPESKGEPNGGQELLQMPNIVDSKKPQNKIDNFYFFSPPIETEGGFLPRQPAVDGPFYQHKYEQQGEKIENNSPQLTTNQPEEGTIRTVVPQAVTPDPLLGNTGSAPCTSGGRRYRHGELLTGMGACRMCFCFDGGVVCQEPSCGAVPPGCTRGPAPTPSIDSPRDSEPDRCCGSIQCGDGHQESPLLFADDTLLPDRVLDVLPEVTTPLPGRPPVVEPVPDLVPDVLATTKTTPPSTTTTSTTTPTTTTTTKSTRKRPTSTTTTTTSTTTTTTTTTTTPTPTSTTTKTTTTAASTPARRPVTKPPAKLRTTTRKPTTSTTTTTSTTSTPAVKSTTTATSSSSPSSTTTTSTRAPQQTSAPLTTIALRNTTPSTAATLPTNSSTPRPTTQSSIIPTRKGRPTTTPPSFFAALWGDEDESTNEAQDKVDEDVQYQDFVSTNTHEQAAPPTADEDDDSFSFDKFLELFMKPESTPVPVLRSTARPPPPSTPPPRTPPPRVPDRPVSRLPATTPRPASSPGTTPAAANTTTSTVPPSSTPRVGVAATTRSPTTTPKTNSSTPSSPAAASTSSRPLAAVTKPPPRTPPPAKRTNITTTKPKPSPAKDSSTSTAKPPTKTITKSTPRPATTSTTTKASTSPRPTGAPSSTVTPARTTPVRTTPTTPSTPPSSTTVLTTTPAPATLRPASLLLGSNKYNPTSSYPAQQHHLGPRRPPPRPSSPPSPTYITSPSPLTTTSTTTRRPSTQEPSDPAGLSGLLKLAGCNIYGRMYRVGKIIQELSGPCLECRCTEVGVQCRQLDC